MVKKNTAHKNVKVKQSVISLKELKPILDSKKLLCDFDGKYLSIKRKPNRFIGLFISDNYSKDYLIQNPNSIRKSIVDNIRKDFNVRFVDGVDNLSFYDKKHELNDEIKSYKYIIYKLSKT